MPYTIRRVEYFHAMVNDEPGEAYKVLTQVADLGISLLAFSATPIGPMRTHLTLFPDDPVRLKTAAARADLVLDGPHHAFLVQGDDELGAVARIHRTLAQASVSVYASSGVSDGRGAYGYVIYVKAGDFDRAAASLGV